MEKKTDIVAIQNEINNQVSNPQVFSSLLAITFKGLKPESAKQAMLEGMMRGFAFQDFLQKDIYAIPFGGAYTLVTSIDYNRKVGMRSGVCGVSAPVYTEDKDQNIITCEITVKRLVGGIVGDFTALVYFKEYTTGFNQWKTRPRTMIAKVAEMHALRKACPEQLSQSYIEEEYERETKFVADVEERKEESNNTWKEKLEASKSLEELGKVWADMPATLKQEPMVVEAKDKLKEKFSGVTEIVTE